MNKIIKFSKRNPREYHKELLNNPPEKIEYRYNKTKGKSEHQLTNNYSFKNKLVNLFLKSKLSNKIGIFIPNIFLKSKNEKYDYIHSFNRLCISRKPYILELENGTAFLHYQPQKINLFTSYVVKKFILSNNLKGIVFNSEASMRSFEKLFPDLCKLEVVKNKSKVIYPLVPKNELVNERTIIEKSKKDTISFLFISSTFHLKGGKELLNAFLKLQKNNKNIELKIISKIKDIPLNMYSEIENNESIKFIESNLSRKELYENHYLKSDVFILPTFRDSFGLVILEAMKNGLPIISTNTFAIPELVGEENGILLNNKYSFFNQDYSVNYDYWGDSLLEFVQTNYDDDLEKEIYESMNLMLNKELRIKMSLESFRKAEKKELGEKCIRGEWEKIFN